MVLLCPLLYLCYKFIVNLRDQLSQFTLLVDCYDDLFYIKIHNPTPSYYSNDAIVVKDNFPHLFGN